MPPFARRSFPLLFPLTLCLGCGAEPSSEPVALPLDASMPMDFGSSTSSDLGHSMDLGTSMQPDAQTPSDLGLDLGFLPDAQAMVTPEMGRAPLADAGLPPELDPSNPLFEVPPVERVLPETLIQHIEQLSWQPQEQRLVFALSLGGPATVPKVADDDPTAKQAHPFRIWSLQARADGWDAHELMRLPAKSYGLGEKHWCKWAMSLSEFWCQHYLAKGAEQMLRVKGGNGLDVPLDYDRWPIEYKTEEGKTVRSLHESFLDLEELRDGTLFWTLNSGQSGQDTSILAFRPPHQGTLELLLRDKDLYPYIHGLAVSQDEKRLFFSTGGYGKEQAGAVWSASFNPDGTLATPKKLIEMKSPRDLTTDEFGNIYVAQGLEVHVLGADGTPRGILKVVEDEGHREAIEKSRATYSVQSVAFGGVHGNELYIGLGHDMRGNEFISPDRNMTHKLGGLFRVPLKARGAWVVEP